MWGVLAGIVAGGALCFGGAVIARRWLEVPPPQRQQLLAATVGAVLGGLLAGRLGFGRGYLEAAVLMAVLITASLIDLRERIIPNELLLWTLAAWPVLRLISALGPAIGGVSPVNPWFNALVGGLAAGGLLLGLALIYPGGMGMGDVKLAAVFGFYLGWPAGLAALLLAFILGGFTGAALLATGRVRRRQHIPFGPFLAVGALIILIWGQPIWNIYWYG